MEVRCHLWDVVVGDLVSLGAGWSHANPSRSFAILCDHVAFYASQFDYCSVDGEILVPQPGDFYAGWITSTLARLFKDIPGNYGW